jgi:predicted house-cleaning noncanonical NTP pyrophosphatase (MazG superfamily)
MPDESNVIKLKEALPKLKVYYQSVKTDAHWIDFEEAFFGADTSKPKPDRYRDINFGPETMSYKLAALAYWLVFSADNVPHEIKDFIEQKGLEALDDRTVFEKMNTLKECFDESIEAAQINRGTEKGEIMVLP